MSIADDALDGLLAETLLDRKKLELRDKKIEIDHNRVVIQHEQMLQHQKDLEGVRHLDINSYSGDQVEALVSKNEEYIDAAKRKMRFINKVFDNIVPFFKKNLILIGASTGNGKSTIVCNVVRELMMQMKDNGKQRRALILTNEEAAEDCYNRVTALFKGYNYSNHDKITEEQKVEYSKGIRVMAGSGAVTVIDNNHGGVSGVTTTLEGIQGIFDNIIANNLDYDCILIDYYQNVKASKKDPLLDEWKVQAAFAAMLDQYKNVLPCPILLLAQVNKETDKNKQPFEQRIKGRKIITDPCTLVMEIVREHEYSRTKWIVHKSRFTQAIGEEMYTGFDRGAYVPYDDAFIAKAASRREKFMKNAVAEATGKAPEKKDEAPEQPAQ